MTAIAARKPGLARPAANASAARAGDPEASKLAYRIGEAAKAIGYGRSKLYELIKAGKIAAKKDGNCTIILRSELERYLDTL